MMMRTYGFCLFKLFLATSLLAGCANATEVKESKKVKTNVVSATKNCETSNSALEEMPYVAVTLTRKDGTQRTLKARLANNNRTRAAGFQRICLSTVEETPILFTFRQEQVPSFHMHNVVVPLDIAFIKQNGEIDTIYTMQPYSIVSLAKPLYSPESPVVAALEVHEGFFEQHKIDRMSKIAWRQSIEPIQNNSNK